MPKIGGPQSEGVQAVVLALRILELLAAEGRALGVTRLAEALGTTKSRIHRHLQTLVQQGYVFQSSDTERYEIGARLVTLARSVGDRLDLAGAALATIRELRDALGHFSVASAFERDGMRVVATVSGKASIEIGVKQGSVLPYHASAQGKIALAFADETVRTRVLRPPLEALTPKTIVSVDALRAEIETVRGRGWATAPDEALTGVNALAAPIFDASETLVGAVAIVDSVQFLGDAPSEEQIRTTVAAGRQISSILGHRPV